MNGLAANVDAAFKQGVFDLQQRLWLANIHHDRMVFNLGRTAEVAERVSHSRRLWITASRLKLVCFENA